MVEGELHNPGRHRTILADFTMFVNSLFNEFAAILRFCSGLSRRTFPAVRSTPVEGLNSISDNDPATGRYSMFPSFYNLKQDYGHQY